MYQSQQQYGQQYGQHQYGRQQTMQHMHLGLNDQDMANTVLNELKRIASEYATACTEAAAPHIRRTFEQLLHQTLADQGQLFHMMSRLNMYGQPVQAQHSDIQREIEQCRQTDEQLQQLVQQWHASERTAVRGDMYAQPVGEGRYNTASATGPGHDMQQSGMQREHGMQQPAMRGTPQQGARLQGMPQHGTPQHDASQPGMHQ